MEILPPAQRALWSRLAAVGKLGFVLYGGTAIALRLGHRISVDFDFFSDRSFTSQELLRVCDFLAGTVVLQEQPDSYTVLVPDGASESSGVKVSFFGGLGFGRVGKPSITDDAVLQVASLEDLMATKLKVVMQRVESRDYLDIAAMVAAGVRLDNGLAAARVLYGRSFQSNECLKALVYFHGGDLDALNSAHKQLLVNAVRAVGDLPTCVKASAVLSI
ncbi:MAG: nucleotidyl transferase AbiEii/AbiGii toxin family protein [Candidatus Obscuribacterales bacterium]|nr:nucleotidyl transferase AbiEii/AbiGii toxin family protein [Steroidobacteraceae bacterium]